MSHKESSGAKRKQKIHAHHGRLLAYRARMGKKRGGAGTQENSFLIHVSTPCSLSLVPVKSFGMNHSSVYTSIV